MSRIKFFSCISVLGFVLFLSHNSHAQTTSLKIGLIPEQNVFRQMKRYEPVADYIEKRTGIAIQFTILPRYGNILDTFLIEKMDGAFWGSFTGALAIEKLGIEPIARPHWKDGTSTYHGHLFARKDSGITDVPSMKNKSIVFVDKATTAGFIFPIAYLKEHGVDQVDTYFSEHFFAGSHDAAIAAVLDGKADIGCAKNTIFELVAADDPRVNNDLVVLADSDVVPSNGLGMRKDLDPQLRKTLQNTLLEMNQNPEGQRVLSEFGATHFILTSREDYSPVFDLAKKAGLNLKTYDYRNE